MCIRDRYGYTAAGNFTKYSTAAVERDYCRECLSFHVCAESLSDGHCRGYGNRHEDGNV